MTSFQSSELTELPVVENSQLFAQRVHGARTAHGTPPNSCTALALRAHYAKCAPYVTGKLVTHVLCGCTTFGTELYQVPN